MNHPTTCIHRLGNTANNAAAPCQKRQCPCAPQKMGGDKRRLAYTQRKKTNRNSKRHTQIPSSPSPHDHSQSQFVVNFDFNLVNDPIAFLEPRPDSIPVDQPKPFISISIPSRYRTPPTFPTESIGQLFLKGQQQQQKKAILDIRDLLSTAASRVVRLSVPANRPSPSHISRIMRLSQDPLRSRRLSCMRPVVCLLPKCSSQPAPADEIDQRTESLPA